MDGRIINRRQFGRGVSALGLATAATGCGIQTGPDAPTAGTAKSYPMRFPARPPGLPGRSATVRLLSGGPGGKSAFFHQLVPNYRRVRHLTIAYDELPNDKIGEVLSLQLRNGQADDIFPLVGVDLNAISAAGQVLALEDVVPGFRERARQVPFGVLVPGVNQFNGKTYAISTGTARNLSGFLIYNSALLRRAEYAPSVTDPFDWVDLRAAAKKCTQQGNSRYYGVMLGGAPADTFGGVVLQMAQCAGALVGGGFNWKTGEYNYADDAVVAAIELFQQMQSDGSLFPGWVTMTDQVARARMPQEQGAMILNGAWNYSVWAQQNPTFRYGIAPPPGPQRRPLGKVGYAVGGGNTYAVFARSKPPQRAMAGDILRYMISEDGQRAWALLVGSSDPVWSPTALADARRSADLTATQKQTLQMYDAYCRLLPSPLIRNADNAQVALELAPVHPSFGEVVQGALIGKIHNVKKALLDLDRRSEQGLDAAISAARKKGVKPDRDDWKFPTWNPDRDFDESQYKDSR